ncbi:MAG: PEP/pyruvate-binding domain-containing protein [Desulfoarculaceae bacterium]|nr:PEP/pyruvate-binding domain-containing protein [Desulfoarculaceae bacterium]
MKASADPYLEAEKIRGKLLLGKFPRDIIAQFKDAVRTVYASSLSRDVLTYRSHRGLWNKYEEMALLVQRVSGDFYGNIYMPQLAGVGYSFNPFVWDPEIDPAQGVLRLVYGLGTRAVDQHDDDYTRIVALNTPLKRPEVSTDDVHRYSQHTVDVLDLINNVQASSDFETLVKTTPGLPLELFAVRDSEMEKRASQFNVRNVFSWMLTFKNVFTRTTVVEDMREMLSTIAKAYAYPVDIEFAINFSSDNSYRINLLQCRPFQIKMETGEMILPEDIEEKDIILKTSGPIIGQAVAKQIDRIIYVIPSKYSVLTPSERFSVARLIGELTNELPGDKNTMMVGPGRWGTKMPELGVPVSFNDIRNVSVPCELAIMHEKLTPDISLGTHFFNDLVEMGIVYMGVFPGKEGTVFNEKLLLQGANILSTIYKKADRISAALHVADVSTPEMSVFIHANTLNREGIVFQEKNGQTG